MVEVRPEDEQRTIADIIGWLANFKDKIKWAFTRDLKPRVLYGLKADGTPIFIGNAEGFPLLGMLPPVLLLTETLTWTVAASQVTSDIACKGYRQLWMTVAQSWTTVPATLTMQPNFSDEAGTQYSDHNDEMLKTLTPANLRMTIHPLIYTDEPATAGASGFPIGDVASHIRLQYTTTDPSVGSLDVRIYGVR